MGTPDGYTGMVSAAGTWAPGTDGTEIRPGGAFDSYENCSAIFFLSRIFFHPSCWFTTDTYTSDFFECGTKGLCYYTSMALRGAEMEAGIVLGCILLSHIVVLSVCMFRLHKLAKARIAGYEPTQDKSVYEKTGRNEALVGAWCVVVVTWATALLIVNRGRGQMIGSVVAMVSVFSLVVVLAVAAKMTKEKRAAKKEAPPKLANATEGSGATGIVQGVPPSQDYGTDASSKC